MKLMFANHNKAIKLSKKYYIFYITPKIYTKICELDKFPYNDHMTLPCWR